MSPAYRSLNLVMLGPPAAGKGTQARALGARYHIPHISVGELLRDQVERGTELGKRLKAQSIQREMGADNLIRGLIRQRLVKEVSARGFLLDGYPCSLEQAGMLDDMLAELGRNIVRVIVLSVPDEVVLKRVNGSNVAFKGCLETAAVDDVGENAEQELSQREALEQRLQHFHQETKPVIELYRRRGMVAEINGNGTPEEVEAAIIEAVGAPLEA